MTRHACRDGASLFRSHRLSTSARPRQLGLGILLLQLLKCLNGLVKPVPLTAQHREDFVENHEPTLADRHVAVRDRLE